MNIHRDGSRISSWGVWAHFKNRADRREARKYLGYFVWTITILRKNHIFSNSGSAPDTHVCFLLLKVVFGNWRSHYYNIYHNMEHVTPLKTIFQSLWCLSWFPWIHHFRSLTVVTINWLTGTEYLCHITVVTITWLTGTEYLCHITVVAITWLTGT